MKIRTDKIDRNPPHGIKSSDVRRILAAAPTEWLADLAEVHLSNALGRNPYTYFNRYSQTLTIYSRGLTPDQLVCPILLELAAHALGIRHLSGGRFTKADTQRVQRLVQPLADQIIPMLPSGPPRPIYHPSYVVRPVDLPNESA